MKSALLLSGGMDSIALAWWLRPDSAYTVNYGQRPAFAEVRAASAVVEALHINHEVLDIDLSHLGSGDLAGSPGLEMAPVPEWWPFRNQMLITVGAMAAIRNGTRELIIGSVSGDCCHADGTPDFIAKMRSVIEIQEGELSLVAPAIHLTATELIRVSGVPMEVLGWAHSCHVANEACGECRGCQKHASTMAELGYEPY